MIEIDGLTKRYALESGPVTALQQVSLRIGEGERLGLFGPSGSGKTTLLRCVAGLESADHGSIRIDGLDVYDAAANCNLQPWRRPIGMVFQDYALWPHMSVQENVAFPLRHGRSKRISRRECGSLVATMLRTMHLGDLAKRYPSELSGGQRQRVALARALVCRPRILLLDEPFSSLDPHLRHETRSELVEVLDRYGINAIFVSHDPSDCLFVAHKVAVMHNGRLLQVGTCEEVLSHPANAIVARALACGTLVEGSVVTDPATSGHFYTIGGTDQHLSLPAQALPVLAPRPSMLLIGRNAGHLWPGPVSAKKYQQLSGEVVRMHTTSAGWHVCVKIGSSQLEIVQFERPDVSKGERINIAVDALGLRLVAT